MPKSRLSTVEILSRWEAGVSIAEIAEEAHVSLATIYRRLRPDPHRNRNSLCYSALNKEERKEWNTAEKERKKQAQAESVLLARKRGVPWSDEDFEYLEEHGRSKTTLQLAVALGRTFYSVQRKVCSKNIPLRNW